MSITAVLSPTTVVIPPKSAYVFSALGSTSDNLPLSYTWEVQAPIGSEITTLSLSSDSMFATLYPDVNGV